MRVDIDARFNPDEIIRVYDEIEKAATNLKPVFVWAREELRKTYIDHFLSNGGGTWKPLDPEYGAWKASRYPGAPTLIRTGGLFESVSKLEIDEINDMSARFGTNAEVAKFHQYGTWSMPKREIIFEPPMFAKKLADKIADHIEGKVD
jgi:phage gpG-like protein